MHQGNEEEIGGRTEETQTGESKEKGKRWRKRGLKDWKGSRQEEGEIVAREENTKKGERQESIKVLHCWKKKKTLPSATIGLTFLWDTYVSARLSIKIKNYKLLSSVTLLGVITWIWVINEVTAVGDGSVTANSAVTLPCFQWLLMVCLLFYIELFSFSRLKLWFLQLGTKVS